MSTSPTTAPKILAFSGSLRRASWNHTLVKAAAAGARRAGIDVTIIELREFPLPVFDEDLEAASGLPDNAKRLKDLFRAHQGLLIASPEYNSSVTAALKNTLDWLSRPEPGQPPLSTFNGKVAALLSASPGALGGLRGLMHLRSILGNIMVTMLPDQFALSKAHEAFDPQGNIKDDKARAMAEGVAAALATAVRKLHA